MNKSIRDIVRALRLLGGSHVSLDSYTLGGISINEQAECLNKFGIPIPGLYAAGQITGSVHSENRLGGNGLTDAFTFGRIAGKNAARWIKEN